MIEYSFALYSVWKSSICGFWDFRGTAMPSVNNRENYQLLTLQFVMKPQLC